MSTATTAVPGRTLEAILLTSGRPERCLDCATHTARSLQDVDGGLVVINNHHQRLQLPGSIEGVSCNVIEVGTNLGVQARNIAIQHSNSEFMLMLDDDAYVSTDMIKDMVRTFAADPAVGAVCFRVEHNGVEESCLLPTVFHGCACGFRTEALRNISGYPRGFLYYGEEYHIAFRLYQAGYRIVLLEAPSGGEDLPAGVPARVDHAKDRGGRNTQRILRLLVRNNIRTWFSSLPLGHIFPAVHDTLQRYFLVARKEGAMRGFVMGCLGAPWAMVKGLATRHPMKRPVFREAALVEAVARACRRMKALHIDKAVICGAGKFPSSWLREFRRHGISITAFLDTNPCWTGSYIRGVPVLGPAQADAAVLPDDTACVTGLSSLSDRDAWQARMQAWDFTPMPHGDREALSPETSSATGRIDLPAHWELGLYCARNHEKCGIRAFSTCSQGDGTGPAVYDPQHETHHRKGQHEQG